jgi:hypothetical protein
METNNGNGNGNELNDAVEHITTPDGSSDSSAAQERQNQQNTAASVTATGVENSDLTDEINQAIEDNPTGAGSSSGAGSSANAGSQSDTNANADSSDSSESNVVDSQLSDSGDEATSSSSAGGATQSVGGETASGAGASTSNDGREESVDTPSVSGIGSLGSSTASSSEPDSATTSESFEINVEDSASSIEDFDTETVSETFEIDIENVNDDPEISTEVTAFVDEDNTIIITQKQLIENASDKDGDNLTALNLATNDPNATVIANEDGSFSITPSEDFNGDIIFTYDVSDGQDSALNTLNLTVNPVNDVATVEDQSFSMNEDGTITITDEQLLIGASDIDTGDILSVESVSYDGADGVFTDNGDGTYTFAPNENFNGEVDLSFGVSDGTATTQASIDITVDAVNDAPVAGSTAYSVDEDGTLNFSEAQLLANSADIDSEDLSVTEVSYSGTDGIFSDNGDGTYTFAPNENFNGAVSLDVTVVDDGGATDVTTAGIDVIAVNDAPVSGDLAYSVDEDGAITFSQEQLLAQAGDVDGNSLEAGNVSGGDNVTVVDNGDGTFTATPDADFNGDIDLTFDVTDGIETVQANIDLTVNPVNDVATVEDQSFSMNEDGTITITDTQLLSGSSDIDAGDTLSVESVAYDGTDGVFTDNGDGTYTFAPNENFNGDVDLSFGVSDGTITTQASIDITVDAVNDAPVAGSTAYSVGEDGTLNFSEAQLLANSADIDSENLSVTEVSYLGTDGVLTENGNGSYSFAPNENFNGDVSLQVSVSDGELIETTTAEVTVIDVNDAPVAGSTSYTMNEDGSITLSDAQLLANSGDVDGSVSVDGVAYSGSDGIFSDNGDGTYTFAPNENFNGEVSLDVTVVDDDGATDVTTAGIDVIAVNDAPVADELAYSVDEDGAITFSQEQLLAQAGAVDGNSLEAGNVSGGDNVTVVDNGDGTFTATPDADFNGDIDLTFDVTDGAETVQANIDLTVNPVNDAPVVTGSGLEQQELSLDNDGEWVSTGDAQIVDGEGILTEALKNQAGGLLYDEEFDTSGGIRTTFEFQIDPDGGTKKIGEGTAIVFNDGSKVDPESFELGNIRSGLGAHGLDSDFMTIRFNPEKHHEIELRGANDGIIQKVDISAFGGIEHETDTRHVDVEMSPDGLLTIKMSFDGGETFEPVIQDMDMVANGIIIPETVKLSFTATTGRAFSEQSISNIEVSSVVDGMLSEVIDEDSSYLITSEELLANASDIDSAEIWVANFDLVESESGTLVDNGDGTWLFTPAANFHGEVEFSYDVSDGELETPAPGFSITVQSINDGPDVSANLSAEMNEDGTITITDAQLLDGATDVDGDDLSIDSVGYIGTEGVFTDNGDGTYTFAPNENFSGVVELNFGVSDGTVVTDANFGVTVNEVNDAPVAGSTSYSVNEDGVITISNEQLLANSSDVEGSVSVANVTYSGEQGNLTDNGDGTYRFEPSENFNGQISLDVTVVDEDGASAQTTAGIDVIAVNDAPLAPTIEFNGEEDQVLVIDPAFIISNASDLDGDQLSLENLTVRQPQNATLQQQPDGMYHLIAPADFNGMIDLAYEVSDGSESVGGSINVNVIPVNDEPFNNGNAHLTTNEDGAFTFNADDMLDLFGDIDTDNLVVSRVIMPDGEDGGDLADNGDGTWTFTPSGDFSGTSEMQVVVSDGELESTLDLPIFVRPIADGAVITTDHEGPLVFAEDSTGHLGLNVDLIDSSEILSNLVITGFPVGFEVSDGTYTIMVTEPGQYIDVTEWNLDDLALTPPEDFAGNFFITVTATTADYGDESSNALTDPSEVAGDFSTAIGEPIILTADDLLEMAEDATQGDVELVHLVDRSQGEIVDNGNGTWTFTPAEGYEGGVDLAYVVNVDGIQIDAQTSIAVQEQSENAPQVDAIAHADVDYGSSLSFTDEDMLQTVTDMQGDELTVESLQLIGGQGLLETDDDGNYTFTPADGFTGEAIIGFVVTDGENSVQSHFNVNVADTQNAFELSDDGSFTIEQSSVLSLLALDDTATVSALDHSGDDGTVIDNGDDSWTFWPDDSFNGDLALTVETMSGGESSEHDLVVQIDTGDVNEASEAVTQTDTVDADQVVTQSNDIVIGTETENEDVDDADVTAAPGSTTSVSIPDDVASHDMVEQVEVSGLPEGAVVENSLPGDDGSFIITGDLSQSVSITLGDEFEGVSDIQFQGLDNMGGDVEGAQAEVSIQIDDQYTMQTNSATTPSANASVDNQGQGADWTSGDNTDVGVDVMDDSSSFESPDHSGSLGETTTMDDDF